MQRIPAKSRSGMDVFPLEDGVGVGDAAAARAGGSLARPFDQFAPQIIESRLGAGDFLEMGGDLSLLIVQLGDDGGERRIRDLLGDGGEIVENRRASVLLLDGA